MTKEEPLIKQLVRTRALNSRDGSLSPTRRPNNSNPRSMSQPPRPRPPAPVFTPLYILPYSLVYPPASGAAPAPKTPKVSFCSVSQPDLTKLVNAPTLTNSLCSTPLSMNLSRCGSPAPPTLSPFSTPPGTPPLLSNQNWFASSQDLNNNPETRNQVCRCPNVRKNTCFSSLCCEICKLFPEKLDNYAAMQQQQNPAINHVLPSTNVENEQITRYVYSAYRGRCLKKLCNRCCPLVWNFSTMEKMPL